LLTPGLIDLHTHGLLRYRYDIPGEFLMALAALPHFGCTTVLPTLTPSGADDTMLRRLTLIARLPRPPSFPYVPGFHLEGPFLALPGALVTTLRADLRLLRGMVEALDGSLAAVSVSPDTEGILPLIRYLAQAEVRVFLTHTQATVEETEAAIDAGARHATHFYDVFEPPPQTDRGVRPCGVVEAVLADPRVTVDFVCDGVHVHPAAIRAAIAAKGWQGVCAITDAGVGAGLPPGDYPTAWGYRVRVTPRNGARVVGGRGDVHDGDLAGSALTPDAAVRNLLQWLDLPEAQVWAMMTLNPARVLGLSRKGVIAPGADADLVLWDEELRPVRTWIRGLEVFQGRGGSASSPDIGPGPAENLPALPC
jgi:N-acetylglucosamine-6-phosphate deacetylase